MIQKKAEQHFLHRRGNARLRPTHNYRYSSCHSSSDKAEYTWTNIEWTNRLNILSNFTFEGRLPLRVEGPRNGKFRAIEKDYIKFFSYFRSFFNTGVFCNRCYVINWKEGILMRVSLNHVDKNVETKHAARFKRDDRIPCVGRD